MKFRKNIAKIFPIVFDIQCISQIFLRHKPQPMQCPCCNTVQRFRLFGLPPRLNALCTNCNSLERHRFLRLFLIRNPELLSGADVLHFAPEISTREYLSKFAGSYVGCDLFPHDDVIKINIEAIDLPDSKFSLIMCSHVLEHVNDKLALKEMFRVLRLGGTALLMFPIIEGWDNTYENPEITSEVDRLRYYGQEDHVRYFGRDARDRIKQAGFELSEYTATEPDISTYGLLRGEKIFIASKPA